jgi:hypothetical protein
VTGMLGYGGTLTVTNLGGILAGGDSFQLFSSANRSNSFATVNLPPLPPGRTWDLNLTNGVLSVMPAVPASPTNLTHSVSNSVLTLSWPGNYLGWLLQVQTNPLNLGLSSNWFFISGSEAVTSTNMLLNTLNPAMFFRMAYTNAP